MHEKEPKQPEHAVQAGAEGGRVSEVIHFKEARTEPEILDDLKKEFDEYNAPRDKRTNPGPYFSEDYAEVVNQLLAELLIAKSMDHDVSFYDFNGSFMHKFRFKV